MCTPCLRHGVASAILGALGLLLVVNGIWLQYSWAGRWGTSMEIGMLFVQYVVSLVLLGGAYATCMKCAAHQARARKK